MKTDFDYSSYQEGERSGMLFGILLGIVIGLAITIAAVFLLTISF